MFLVEYNFQFWGKGGLSHILGGFKGGGVYYRILWES